MAIIRPKYLPTVVAQPELDGLNPVPFAAETLYSTPLVDRSATPTFAEFVRLGFLYWGSTSGEVDIYVYFDFGDNTASPPEGDINRSNWTVANVVNAEFATPKWKVDMFAQPPIESWPAKLVHTFTVEPATENYSYSFNVASVMGGMIPPRFAVLLHNKIVGETLQPYGHSSMLKAWCQIYGVQAEVV